MKTLSRFTALCVVTLVCGASLYSQQSSAPAAGPKPVKSRLKAAQKSAASPADDAMSTIFRTHRFEQASVSPDGKRVAWVETVIAKSGAPTGDTTIFVADLNNAAAPHRIAAGEHDAIHAEGSVAWSPDSKQIAFLSDAERRGQLQLYLSPAAGGASRKLTSVKGFLQSPAFSPDGKSVAVLFTENMIKAAGPLVAEEHPTGEIKDAFYEQRLAVIDLASGKLRQLSPADTYIYEYDWSPDSKKFVVSSALGNGDNNWWLAELSTLDVDSGLMKRIYKPKLQIAQPQWSPDGSRIAFIEGLMSDEGLTGGDIHAVSSSGGEAENLAPDRKSSPSWFAWTKDSKILFSEYAGGDSAIALLDPPSRRAEPLWRGAERINAGGWGPTLSVAADAKTSAVVPPSPPLLNSGPAPSAHGSNSPIAIPASRPLGARPRASLGKTMATKSRAGSSTPRTSTPRKNTLWSSMSMAAPATPCFPIGPTHTATPFRFPRPAISSFFPIRAAATARAKPSLAAT